MSPRIVRLGTRGSALATTQSRQVAARLTALGARCELVPIRTRGDVDRGPLAAIGGTGVFVTAVRDALLSGEVDVAVHSYKDLPTAPAPGVLLAAVPTREDPADVLCARDGMRLAELPVGATVGTGSPRRRAQLLALRGDLEVRAVRGNVDTRLGRVVAGDLDAVVLAAAGLVRLGRSAAVTERFAADRMLPAPAQGALAIECRDETGTLATLLGELDDLETRATAAAERRFLTVLEAGCIAPVGALATVGSDGLWLTGAVISADGATALRGTAQGPLDAAEAIGDRLAGDLLGRGAAELLGSAR